MKEISMDKMYKQKRPQKAMNLLMTLDAGYLHQLCVLLASIKRYHPDTELSVYILHTALTDAHFSEIQEVLASGGVLIPIKIDTTEFSNAPTTDRYPPEMYYRLLAAKYLPDSLERILYLDPDTVVLKSLWEFYNIPFDGCLLAAASHVGKMMTMLNAARLDTWEKDEPYINSGVMLLNLKQLRISQNEEEIYSYIRRCRNRLILPDQDIISGLYGSEIKLIDPFLYNMTERIYEFRMDAEVWHNLDWVKSHTVIVHYCGRNKPWKNKYIGALNIFYEDAEAYLNSLR